MARKPADCPCDAWKQTLVLRLNVINLYPASRRVGQYGLAIARKQSPFVVLRCDCPLPLLLPSCQVPKPHGMRRGLGGRPGRLQSKVKSFRPSGEKKSELVIRGTGNTMVSRDATRSQT